jgi:NADH-quinone oxidoreductase subunit C
MHSKWVDIINNSGIENPGATLHEAEVGDSSITVNHEVIRDVCFYLRDHAETKFNVLQVITGTDYDDRIEVSYILASYVHNTELILKVKLPKDGEGNVPSVYSVDSVWRAANFLERETYDMLGVIFDQHPDFRRILCPEDWEGFPLRRDYEVVKSYRGMEVNPEHKINSADHMFAQKLREQAEDPKKITGSWKDS